MLLFQLQIAYWTWILPCLSYCSFLQTSASPSGSLIGSEFTQMLHSKVLKAMIIYVLTVCSLIFIPMISKSNWHVPSYILFLLMDYDINRKVNRFREQEPSCLSWNHLRTARDQRYRASLMNMELLISMFQLAN